MALLSGLFGGGDDFSSSNDQSSSGSIVSDLTSTLGLDLNSSQSSYDQDEDGNVSYDTNDFGLNLDTSTDGLLGALGEAMSSNDQTTD